MTLSKIPTLDSHMCPDHRWHLDVQMTRSHHLPTPPHTHIKALTRAATLLGQLHVLRVRLLHPVPPQPKRVPTRGFPRVTEAGNLRCWWGIHGFL